MFKRGNDKTGLAPKMLVQRTKRNTSLGDNAVNSHA